MSNYITVDNDTFAIIARKKYGDEQQAIKIAKANPGVNEPLSKNINIIVPDILKSSSKINANNIDEVSLLIDNKMFRFWTRIRINRSIDNMDTIEFDAPFDSDINSENINSFRKIFKPFSFKSVVVNVGDDVLFTGVMIGVNPNLETNSKTISISCYSLPGVLNDCTTPASAYPLEFRNLNLKDIANTMIEPFGLTAEFTSDPGDVFEIVSAKENETILSFLTVLAKQRNLIISSTSDGKLLFQQSKIVGNPVAKLFQGQSPVVSITSVFNPQNYYSHITGIQPITIGVTGAQYTVKNSRLNGILRPNTFIVPDTNAGDVKTAVQARIGRMFGNMVTYSVELATWRDSNGKLWQPNTTLILHAHDVMIYKNYEFIIKDVDFNRDSASESAVLNLVIPGSFEGKIPKVLPWDA